MPIIREVDYVEFLDGEPPPPSYRELVIIDQADETAALRELTRAYREMLSVALGQLAEANREREDLRRRVAALCDALRAMRDADQDAA